MFNVEKKIKQTNRPHYDTQYCTVQVQMTNQRRNVRYIENTAKTSHIKLWYKYCRCVLIVSHIHPPTYIPQGLITGSIPIREAQINSTDSSLENVFSMNLHTKTIGLLSFLDCTDPPLLPILFFTFSHQTPTLWTRQAKCWVNFAAQNWQTQ